MDPAHLALLQQVALAKARKLAAHKPAPAPGTAGGPPLTPASMSQADIEQKMMAQGLLDPTKTNAEQGMAGGVDQAPQNILSQTPAGAGAPVPPAPVAPPAPAAPLPAAPAVGGKLGPGVQMDPKVVIKPSAPRADLVPSKSRSDMPDPHAPEPQDEEPDPDDEPVDEEDGPGYRMG